MNDADILERIPNMSALVVGDICLEYRCAYDEGLSVQPESGDSRLAVVASEFRPSLGGAIASDLAALGCGRVAVLGVAGQDGHGLELQNCLRERGISTENLIRTPEAPTLTAMRFFNSRTGEEDQRRIDFIATRRLAETLQRQIANRYQSVFDGFNFVFIADYAAQEQGVITEPLRRMVDELAPTYPDKLVFVTSSDSVLNYRRVILQLDRNEAENMSIEVIGRVDFAALRDRLRARLLVITEGGQGIAVYDARGEVNIPASHPYRSESRDAVGAFGAAFGIALAITRDVYRATEFGNLVAAITAAKRSEGIARPHEILYGAR